MSSVHRSDAEQLVAAAAGLYCAGPVRPIALERAAVWLRRGLSDAPRDPGALQLLGLVELERGRCAEASRAFRLLTGAAEPHQRLEGLVGLAACQLARHRPGRALDGLAQVRWRDLALVPRNVQVVQRFYALKAHAHLRSGDRKRAQLVLRRAIDRLERAGCDAEPLLFELALSLDRDKTIDDLPLVELSAGPAARPAPRFSYTMKRAVWRRIVATCRGRHEERCALLLGRGRRIERIRWLRNRDPLPELACVSSPAQRMRLWQQERQRGWVLLAEFHSHTAGPAVPSRADCAARDRLLVIYSDVYADLRAWRVKRTYRQTLAAQRGIRIDPGRRASNDGRSK